MSATFTTDTTTQSGRRIEEARTQMGMSQRDLANETGISQPVLSRIESGQRHATNTELVVIAASLGTTVGRLLGTSFVADELMCAGRDNPESMLEHMAYYFEVADHLDRLGV
jgi:transcriptional regulator with XRE-family HTH domain